MSDRQAENTPLCRCERADVMDDRGLCGYCLDEAAELADLHAEIRDFYVHPDDDRPL